MAVNFYIRRWLNKERHHAGAYVIATVKTNVHYDKDKKKKWVEVDADLTLADCNRVISLDLGSYGTSYDRDRKNVLYKAHALRHAINQFVDAVEQAYDEMDEELKKKN